MIATEQYFLVVLFIMLHKVDLTFESADEILKCDRSNESYWALLSCSSVYYGVQGQQVVLTFESVNEFLKCDHSNESYWSHEQCFLVVLFIMLYKVVLTFESVDGILKYDHSNQSYRAVLSCGTVYCAVQGGSNFWVCGWNPQVWSFKWKPLSSAFL